MNLAYECHALGNPLGATNVVVGYLDDLLAEGKFAGADALLRAMDLGRLPVGATTAALAVASHAHRAREPGVDYPAFYERAMATFATHPDLENDRAARIASLASRFDPACVASGTYSR